MGISKKQLDRIEKICQCGCGNSFFPFPVYGEKGEGLKYPQYMRGHHPNTKKRNATNIPWNKGLTKDVCPTLARMGYQPGHKPYNNWDHVIELQRNDPEYRRRWLESKKNQVPWNKGKTKTEYAHGIKTGPEHGNWCGGLNGIRDTSKYKKLCAKIRKRDKYTCQHCGDHSHKGRGSQIILDVHHVIAYSENPLFADDPKNLITLCRACHIKTPNYGTKLINQRRKQGGK